MELLNDMKVVEAKSILSEYRGDELYKQASELYTQETNARIELRAHGKTPTRGLVESVVKEMDGWIRQVADGLAWSDYGSVDLLLQFERPNVWIKYNIEDPEIDAMRKRYRLETLKGNPHALIDSTTEKGLDAMVGWGLANLRESLKDVPEESKDEEQNYR